MSDIPGARNAIDQAMARIRQKRTECLDDAHDLAGVLDILEAAKFMTRRRPGNYRTTRQTRATMTPALAKRIKAWADAHPRWDNQRIAEKFNVTNARVSIILNGFNK